MIEEAFAAPPKEKTTETIAVPQKQEPHSLLSHASEFEMWGTLIGGALISLIVIGKVLHFAWKNKRDDEERKKLETEDREFVSHGYRELIESLQEQIDSLSKSVRELEYLRDENTQLKIDIESLKTQNRQQAREISELRARLRELDGGPY